MEIDRLFLSPACYYTSAMPVSLTVWLCVKIYTSVEHDFLAGQKGWLPKTGSTVAQFGYSTKK